MFTRAHVVLLLLAGTLSAITPLDVRAQDRARVARQISTFGLEVFRHVASAAPGPNVVFSPLSAGLAVALLTEGTEGETRAELLTALGSSSDGWDEYQSGIRALLKDLNRDKTTITRIASSLWADEGRVLRPGFVRSAERLHLATVQSVDLQGGAAKERINGWAREKTDGRISDVMPSQRPDLTLILLNAVYFKGKWELRFDSTKTRLAPFLLAGRDSVQAMTMVREGNFGHFEHNGEKGLRIPYKGGRYAAYVVVSRSASVQNLVSRLTVSSVDAWKSRARAQATMLYLPRVEHHGTWSLLGPLAKAGAPRVVSDRAQLGAIWATRQGGPTLVQDASQGTFLKIDEEGTEAAAVTMVSMNDTVEPTPVDFRVDAPFLFVIRDEVTGALLFVARVGDPTNRGG